MFNIEFWILIILFVLDILNSVNLNNINFQNCNGSLNGIQNKNEDLSKFKTLLLDPFDSLNNHMDDKKSTPNVSISLGLIIINKTYFPSCIISSYR